MAIWNHYLQPKTVEGALDGLANAKGDKVIIAGGTDLLLDIQQGRHPVVDTMVDISSISEMCEVKIVDKKIFLGAAVTHSEIVQHPLLFQHAQCLVEGCGLIGGPQVRNVATIGGNVSHALPAGDGAIALHALNAEALLASHQGRRWVSIGDLYAGPGKTTFDKSKEIVVGFRFDTKTDGDGSAFHRVMRPQGVAIAIQNMAIWINCSPTGIINNVRIAMGPAGPKPFRALKAEAVLCGKMLNPTSFQDACLALSSEAKVRTSAHRATAEYRQSLIPVLLKRVIQSAYQRSVGKDIVL